MGVIGNLRFNLRKTKGGGSRHGKSSHPYHPGWCKICGGGVKFFVSRQKNVSVGVSWCKKFFLGGVKARRTFFF